MLSLGQREVEIKNKTKPRMKAMGSYAVSENWAEVRMEIT